MSHFTVVVCAKDPDRLDEILAPFDENLETEPRRDYETGGPEDHWSVAGSRKEGLLPDGAVTWTQVAEAHNKRYSEDPILLDEDGRAYQMTTRNPQAKWDWWTIGGRWSGYFVGVGGSRCDSGRKSALDLDALRALKAAEARITHAKFRAVIAGTPEPVPWRTYADNISEGSCTIDEARREYHAQPRITALRDSEDFRWHDADDIEELGRPEALYVERARARAVPGYATITADGRWMAPGRMGWWGMSDDEEGDRIGYWEAANAYIDSLPDDVYLIAVDCHI